MTEREEAVIPIQYTHSVKISDTQKGIRIDVHVWANDRTTAVQEALDTYIEAKKKAEWAKIPVAPVEVINQQKEAVEGKEISLTDFRKHGFERNAK